MTLFLVLLNLLATLGVPVVVFHHTQSPEWTIGVAAVPWLSVMSHLPGASRLAQNATLNEAFATSIGPPTITLSSTPSNSAPRSSRPTVPDVGHVLPLHDAGAYGRLVSWKACAPGASSSGR